nr:MAG TPA: hypothetical protein [Caudoviricetes sp.]
MLLGASIMRAPLSASSAAVHTDTNSPCRLRYA